MALSAEYSTAHQFTVSGDQTSVFIGGRAVRVDCGIDGIKICYVDHSEFSTPNTTVDLLTNDSDDITANVSTVEVSNLKSGTTGVGNLPVEIIFMNRGLRKFVLPTWNAVGTLGITPGFIHIFDGTREKILTVEAALTKAISALTVDTWYYIYLTAPANHGLSVVATDISVSTTAPTYSEVYKGWYDGVNRCLGFFKSNAAGTMKFFKTDGHYYRFNNGTTKSTVINTDGVWVNVTFDIPTFAGIYLIGECNFTMIAEHTLTNVYYYVRDFTKDAPCENSTWFSGPSSPLYNRYTGWAGMVAINTSKQVITLSSGGSITTYWNCNGIWLPSGLNCS